MAQSSKRNRAAKAAPKVVELEVPAGPAESSSWLTRPRAAIVIVLLLALHYALAADSLRRENPTVDEIAHLPAGISYWQKGTFKLYHHNPPLTKLIAALPVLWANPITDELYNLQAWAAERQSVFGEFFAFLNAPRYFEMMTLGRMVMPLFSAFGGVFIYLWSSRLYGRAGGLLSLALWCVCPNVLAHARLITSDAAGAAISLAATYVFWRYLREPSWKWTIIAGIALGIAQLTKFSAVLLYAYWPMLWVMRIVIERDWVGFWRLLLKAAGQGAAVVVLSVLVINVGYGFEGVGKPLGSFEFASESLTRPITSAELTKGRPSSANGLLALAWQHRINKFRGTFLGTIPTPLPSQYLLGFDDQRLETEGIPMRWVKPDAPADERTGYPVYLDGTLRRSGWWYYYLACLVYKVPEGTWLLVALSGAALIAVKRSRAAWFDEFTVLVFPAIVLFAMSFLTDINLGLRYVLPVFPFVFVGVGKVVPWVGSWAGKKRWIGVGFVVLGLGLTTLQTALIHPSYLANFNWISGGPNRGDEHLIDSNLDWGQDLVGLQRWVAKNRPGQAVGFAYFGQINPNIFLLRGEPFAWFLPPAPPGTVVSTSPGEHPGTLGLAEKLRPGLYAVSASFVRGLPFRFYDSGNPVQTVSVAWNATGEQGPAFGYFSTLKPIAKVGYSIFVYELNQADCDRLNPLFAASKTQ